MCSIAPACGKKSVLTDPSDLAVTNVLEVKSVGKAWIVWVPNPLCIRALQLLSWATTCSHQSRKLDRSCVLYSKFLCNAKRPAPAALIVLKFLILSALKQGYAEYVHRTVLRMSAHGFWQLIMVSTNVKKTHLKCNLKAYEWDTAAVKKPYKDTGRLHQTDVVGTNYFEIQGFDNLCKRMSL